MTKSYLGIWCCNISSYSCGLFNFGPISYEGKQKSVPFKMPQIISSYSGSLMRRYVIQESVWRTWPFMISFCVEALAGHQALPLEVSVLSFPWKCPVCALTPYGLPSHPGVWCVYTHWLYLTCTMRSCQLDEVIIFLFHICSKSFDQITK